MHGSPAEAAAQLDRGLTPKLVDGLRSGYGLQMLRADALAGLTVAIVALPLSMAIAIASGLPPERGLFTAIVGGFLISALGGSRYQIGGPAGAFIVLVFGIVQSHGYDGLVIATLMAGLIMVLIGVLRLGGLIMLMPHSVIVGFTSGIAVIIFASQIKDLTGIELAYEPAAFLPKLAALAAAAPTLKPLVVLLSLGCVLGIMLLRAAKPGWPGFLIVAVGAAVLVGSGIVEAPTIGQRFGDMPRGLPAPSLPDLSFVRLVSLLPWALAIALLGSIESLLSAVVADRMSGDRHRPNGELVAQGLANIASVAMGGFCVTGTIARTATNVRAGAASPVSGMLHAGYLLLFLIVAAPLAQLIPLPALAAILAVVAWNMAEKAEFRRLLASGMGDRAALLATFLLTVVFNLLVGLAAGIAIAVAVGLWRRRAVSPSP